MDGNIVDTLLCKYRLARVQVRPCFSKSRERCARKAEKEKRWSDVDRFIGVCVCSHVVRVRRAFRCGEDHHTFWERNEKPIASDYLHSLIDCFLVRTMRRPLRSFVCRVCISNVLGRSCSAASAVTIICPRYQLTLKGFFGFFLRVGGFQLWVGWRSRITVLNGDAAFYVKTSNRTTKRYSHGS